MFPFKCASSLFEGFNYFAVSFGISILTIKYLMPIKIRQFPIAVEKIKIKKN